MRTPRIRIPLRLPCPVERRRRQHRSNHVVRMCILAAVPAKRNHNVWPELPYPLHQPPRSYRELDKLQSPVLVVQQFIVRHTQHLARTSKLLAPHLPQLLTCRRVTPIRCCLSIRQADHIRLNGTVGRQGQRSTKRKALIIRMRHHAHQLQPHSAPSRSASSNSSSAEISSISASGSTPRTGAKLLRCSAQGPISANARLCAGVA